MAPDFELVPPDIFFTELIPALHGQELKLKPALNSATIPWFKTLGSW